MENAKNIFSSTKEMDEFEEKVIAWAIAISNGNNCNRIIDVSGSIENPNGINIKVTGTIKPRINRPRLTYDIKAKALRIIEYKSKLDSCINYLIVSSLLFLICIYYISNNFDRYMQIMDVFFRQPFFREFDFFVLMTTTLVVIVLFFIASFFSYLYDKFKSYKKDLISFLGSQICFCNRECNCREAFIIVMHKEYKIKLY